MRCRLRARLPRRRTAVCSRPATTSGARGSRPLGCSARPRRATGGARGGPQQSTTRSRASSASAPSSLAFETPPPAPSPVSRCSPIPACARPSGTTATRCCCSRSGSRRVSGAGPDELWVRVFPDDCLVDTFEPDLSEREVASAERYWTQVWSAGGAEPRLRAAWRELVASHGSGRAACIVAQFAPASIATSADEAGGAGRRARDRDEGAADRHRARPAQPPTGRRSGAPRATRRRSRRQTWHSRPASARRVPTPFAPTTCPPTSPSAARPGDPQRGRSDRGATRAAAAARHHARMRGAARRWPAAARPLRAAGLRPRQARAERARRDAAGARRRRARSVGRRGRGAAR